MPPEISNSHSRVGAGDRASDGAATRTNRADLGRAMGIKTKAREGTTNCLDKRSVAGVGGGRCWPRGLGAVGGGGNGGTW
jgi:hypothetical protein